MARRTRSIDKLRRDLARIVLADYDRNVRPMLKRQYTLPSEPPRMHVPMRVQPVPTKPKH